MNRRLQQGLTLVELMIAMLLGLVIIGGVVSVLLANKRSYSSNEGLSQIQESARSAFELMARDIRQTGGTGCDSARRVANVLSTTTAWWQTWTSISGYDEGENDPAVAEGGGDGERVADTDSLALMGIDGTFPVDNHNAAGAVIRLNTTAPTAPAPFAAGDILVVCDFDHSTIFEAVSYDAANRDIGHDSGGGNCSEGLGFPTDCSTSSGNSYPFPRNSQVGRLYAVDWYVGNNGRAEDGGRSLYRARLGPGGVVVTEEMVSGVIDMQIQYGTNGGNDIVDASSFANAAAWAPVNSVFISLTVRSTDANVSTDRATNAGRLEREFTYVVTLRNRVP